MRSAAAPVLVLALFGCGSSREREASSASDAAAVTVRPSPGTRVGEEPVLSADEAAQLLAAWQGIWVMPYSSSSDGSYGDYDVYEVREAAITRWTGDVSTERRLEILAPCLARVVGDNFYHLQFGFAGPQLRVSRMIGVRRGPGELVICRGESTVLVATPAGCRVLERPAFGRRDRGLEVVADATCSVTPDAADPAGRVEVRYARDRDDERVDELRVDGDLLLPAEDRRRPAFRAASLDDARLRAREHRLEP